MWQTKNWHMDTSITILSQVELRNLASFATKSYKVIDLMWLCIIIRLNGTKFYHIIRHAHIYIFPLPDIIIMSIDVLYYMSQNKGDGIGLSKIYSTTES